MSLPSDFPADILPTLKQLSIAQLAILASQVLPTSMPLWAPDTVVSEAAVTLLEACQNAGRIDELLNALEQLQINPSSVRTSPTEGAKSTATNRTTSASVTAASSTYNMQQYGGIRFRDGTRINGFVNSGLLINYGSINFNVTQQDPPARVDDVPGSKPLCPYPGMRPYEPDDALFFNGREAEIANLIVRIRRQEHLLLVIGPSGYGKSSLVSAGLLPAIVHNWPSDFWHVIRFAPGPQPVAQLQDLLGGDPRQPESTVRALIDQHAPAKQLLISVDPLEKIFTQVAEPALSSAQRQQSTAAEILTILHNLAAQPMCTVVLTLRADFYDRLMRAAQESFMHELSVYHVPALKGDALRTAIRGPAADVRVTVEDRLVERLCADAGDEPGSLPFLQETLLRLWAHMQERTLTLDSYVKMSQDGRSGLAIALAQRADEIYDSLTPSQQILSRKIFLRLVDLSIPEHDIRHPQLRKALLTLSRDPAQVDTLLQILTNNRLLIMSKDSPRSEVMVDLAHDALISGWPQFQKWIGEVRVDLPIQRRLTTAALEWGGPRGDSSVLYRGTRLREVQQWQQRHPDEASPLEEAFIKASQGQRRKSLLLQVLLALCLLALGVAGWRVYQNAAKSAATIAESRRLAAEAMAQLNDHPDLALLLGVESRTTASTFEAKSSLLAALEHNLYLTSILKGHQDSVRSVAFSPDGRILASSSWDKTILLWDVATHQPLGAPLRGHTDAIFSVAFSPNGRILASGSNDTTIILWDVATHQTLGPPLRAHQAAVTSVAFSPDGTTLASGSVDKTVILWDVATRRPRNPALLGHQADVTGVAFSPDGNLLASSSNDGTIILWDTMTRQARGSPLNNNSPVNSIAFRPHSYTLAAGNDDNTIILWNVVTHQPLGVPITGHHARVRTLAFSPDGHTLASGSNDNTIILWDMDTHQPLRPPLIGHRSFVISVAYSPDNHTLASGSIDFSVMLWDDRGHQPLSSTLGQHPGWINSVAFSPDGRILASGSNDDTIILWDMATDQALGPPLRAHQAAVTSVAFSPDGTTLASGSVDKTVILWDVATRRPRNPALLGHQADVTGVAFSPDGNLLASSSLDKTLLLWDVKTHHVLGSPLADHHDWVHSVAFSPDGHTLASSSQSHTNILWDVAKRQALGLPLTGHKDVVQTVAFSPDGGTLASGSWDQTIILWDVATHQVIGEPLTGHKDHVQTLAFSPDGRTLASGSRDTSIILWDLRTESWVAKACAVANRNLTNEEWMQYMPVDTPYHKTCVDLPDS